MCFDDPIYLDRGSFEDLMVDTPLPPPKWNC